MQTYQCECGKSTSWGSMSPAPCARCDECGTRREYCPKVEGQPGKIWIPKPGNYRQPEEHRWETRYNEMTGEPYELCFPCGETREKVKA